MAIKPLLSQDILRQSPLECDPQRREVWKTIPGFEGRYEVSSLGRVRSLSRFAKGDRILSQHERAGYLNVGLYRSAKAPSRLHLVHRLVLSAFVGPCPDGMDTLHINGRSKDNRLPNLRWGTVKENVADKLRHGKFRAAMNERMVLDEKSVKFIKANYRVIKQTTLAEMFGVHRATIQRIHSGERYG